MHIKTAASICSHYNDIAKLCKESGEPVYLTKNGEGDLVVMDITAFERRAKELQLTQTLFNIRTARRNGVPGHSLEETRKVLTQTIKYA
ncbi:MAG: type II toxin-antitoxin system Phd/YefM family antitoxin [Oscillospiraceae bacterium]|nr:type II toxin-antitoxin system Phd/YefM family antitoxin [Oscillospiraceae bacterium]